MSGESLLRLVKRYRQAAAYLSRQATNHQGRALVQHLVQRTYSLVYAPPRLKRLWFFPALFHFLWRTFPASVLSHWSFVIASLVVFSSAAGLTAWLCRPGTEFSQLWLGEELTQLAERVAARHQSTDAVIPLFGRPYAFWIVLFNNWRVALLAFASCLGFLLPGLYILFANGKMVGAVIAYSWHQGTLSSLMGFISPHGAIELPAIIFAGASGLAMAFRWLSPGDYPRLWALTTGARQALPLLIGSLVLLLYAALIEAFVSPDDRLSDPSKMVLGALHLSLLILYLIYPRPGSRK